MITTRRLVCNDLVNPLGIDDTHPVFSWQLTSPERAQLQTAYRILVSSTQEALDQEQGDVWDSGQVHSEQSVQVRFAGRPLVSRQRCYWKVKAWDRDGVEGPWSDSAWFEMGLLRAEDWRGQWIAHPEGSWSEIRPAPYFRKTISLPATAQCARVYLCGLGYHELYVNGRRASDAVLNPAFTRYDRRALYVTYDVTAMLTQGVNVFGVILGNGFYNQAARDAWYFEKSPWRGSPCLLLQAHAVLEDGSEVAVTSDASWQTAEGPIRFDATRLGEVYDARLELPEWNLPGDQAAEGLWSPARIVEGPRGKLSAQYLPPVKVTRTLDPVKMWKSSQGTQVFDMGQNFTGWARVCLQGPAGQEVILRYGEKLLANGDVDLTNINQLVYEGEVQVDRYILKGGGEEVYEPRFTYHGFQYVEIEGAPDELALEDVQGCVAHTAFERAGTFSSSNSLVNRLQVCTEWSFLSNFVGYPTDCPHREKNGWTGDAHLAAEAGLYNFQAGAGYRKWLEDIADEQREDGSLPGIVPTSGWGYEWGNGPCWDSAALLIPWYLYLYRGDRAVLESAYPMMRRYIEYLGAASRGGELIALGLGDWVPPYGRPEDYTAPLTLLSSAYFYMDARIASQTAALLGLTEDTKRYEAWADRLYERFNGLYYDPVSGMYAGGSQTALAMALYAGLVPVEERPRVSRQLVTEIRQQKGRINTGIHGSKAVINALAENGFHSQAYHLIIQPQQPGWVWWLEQGATTLWEDWRGEYSRNHIMFGDISAWFYKYLAGIRPDVEVPGFQRIIFRPFLADSLDWVKAEYECPYGQIRAAWQRGERSLHYEVELPPNTTGRVYLPKVRPGTARVNGETLEQARLSFDVQRTGGLVIQVGSGAWAFDCELG